MYMQINQNNTINGDSSNSKMLYVGCLVFYYFLSSLNVPQIVPIFREQWKTSGSTSSPWSRGSKGSIWDEKKGKKTC